MSVASAVHLGPPRRLARAQARHAHAAGWLAALPALVDDVLARWRLTPERVAEPGGRSSMTILVRRADGEAAALKMCAPGQAPAPAPSPAELEHAALRRWDGWGAVRSLDIAPDAGALLLERLRGETSLRALPDAKAMLEAVEAAHRLWIDPGEDHPFPTVAARTGRQAEGMREVLGAADPAAGEARPLFEEALGLREDLLGNGDGDERCLLHGDFRQSAVLASTAERAPWLAVGPEPVVGERAYDLARLVRDRLHDLVASPGAAALTRRRVAQLAEAVDVDRERLRAWTLFRAVASGARSLAAGDRTDGELLLEFATWL